MSDAGALDAVYPNDPYFPLQDNLFNSRQTGGTTSNDISASLAWAKATDCRKIKIGVVDSGFHFEHPDLFSNFGFNYYEILQYPDRVDNDKNGYVDDYLGWDFLHNSPDAVDDYGHGTGIAGIIGAVGNNAVGMAGVCWRANLVPLKVTDLNYANEKPGYPAPYAALIKAVDYAIATKIKVLHVSSCIVEAPGRNTYSINKLKAAFDRANRAGVVVVMPAGNYPTINLDANLTDKVLIPQQLTGDNLIKVAATDNHDKLAVLTSYGPQSVQVAAPGIHILATIPLEIPILQDQTGVLASGYNWFDGTSLAAPVVTGAIALLLNQQPGLTPKAISEKLVATSDKLPSLAGKIKGGRLNIQRLLTE